MLPLANESDARSERMGWFWRTEREKWASPKILSNAQSFMGLPGLDRRSRELYEHALPRGVSVPRFGADRPPTNFWMPPAELANYGFKPGQIILGKFAGQFIGHLDDRPLVTIAGARAGKTSTVLEPNLYLYPGSMLVLDPKGELSRTAGLRRALGHDVHVLDPFGQSGETSACFNALAELDPTVPTIADDVSSITHALIVDDGDGRAKHWNDSARALLKGLIMLTLMFPPSERTRSRPFANCFF
jgi:type IV secretion system protein VirD4